MKKRINRLLTPILWGGAGVFFLLLMLSLSMNLVQANPERAFAQISAQDSDDLITVLRDEFDDPLKKGREITSNGTFMWGHVITPSQGFSDTLWCVQGGDDGGALSAGIDTYTKNVTTTLTYGPINLNVTAAEFQFSYWISTAAGDNLEWGYSTDNTIFTYTVVSPAAMTSWQTKTVKTELNSLLGSETAYLSLRFQSNDDDDVGLGVFLDDVRVRITEDITAAFTADAQVCLASSIHFSDTSSATSGINTVEWNFGDGITSTKRVTDHLYATTGTYTVWLTATSQVGSQDVFSAAVSVHSVDAVIDVTPFYTYTGNTVCLNRETTFSDASTFGVSGTSDAWQWTVDAVPASVASGFSYTFTVPGPHTVALAVTTTIGCVDTTSISFDAVEPPPIPNLVISGDTDPVETGMIVHFADHLDTNIDTDGWNWIWDFGDGTVITTTTSSVDHIYKYGGAKTVVVTVSAASGCTSVAKETLPVRAKFYMPIVLRKFFTGVEYRDSFIDSSSGWDYGKHITLNPNGTKSDEYYFGYKKDTTRNSYFSDGELYYIRAHDDGDHVFLTGPEDKAFTIQNFVFEASGRTISDNRRGDEYGILISPVPLDPKAPNSKGLPVYTLQTRMKKDEQKQHWVFKKWTIKNSHDHPADELAKGTETAYLTDTTYHWNRFKIERIGNRLICSVYAQQKWTEWETVAQYDMSQDFDTVPEKFYVGLYLAHTRPYSYDFEAQFDDVIVISTPW